MEDEEWEDVIVVSFVPLPITSEENANYGKFKAIERDLTIQTFELKEAPVATWNTQVKSASCYSPTELAVLFSPNSTEPWIYDRTAQYKHTRKPVIAGEFTNELLQAIDHSGKFLIVCKVTFLPWNTTGCKFSRHDLREGTSTELCELKHSDRYSAWPRETYVPTLQVSEKYAYFARGQDLWRFDWRNPEPCLLLAEPGKFPTEWVSGFHWQNYTVNISILGPEAIYFSFWKFVPNQQGSFEVRILKFSENKARFIHSATTTINTGISPNPNVSLQVIKEGLIVKITGSDIKKFYSVTRLYSLSDLRLRATMTSRPTSTYPIQISKVVLIRMKGIPVILDFLDREGKKNLVNFIFLYGNRFHSSTFHSTIPTSGIKRLIGVHSVQVGRQGGEIVIGIVYGLRFCTTQAKTSTYVFQIGL